MLFYKDCDDEIRKKTTCFVVGAALHARLYTKRIALLESSILTQNCISWSLPYTSILHWIHRFPSNLYQKMVNLLSIWGFIPTYFGHHNQVQLARVFIPGPLISGPQHLTEDPVVLEPVKPLEHVDSLLIQLDQVWEEIGEVVPRQVGLELVRGVLFFFCVCLLELITYKEVMFVSQFAYSR